MTLTFKTIVTNATFVLIALAAGVGAYLFVNSYIYNEALYRFEQEIDKIREAIIIESGGIANYITSLESIQGLFAASKLVERDEFQRFFAGSRGARSFPAIRTFAYVKRVPRSEYASFVREVQKDASTNAGGFPNFAITPPGVRDEYYVITYVEPHDESAQLMGEDSLMNPAKQNAIKLARDTGGFAFAHVFYQDQIPYLVVYLPIYKNGAALHTVDERRAAIEGVISARINLKALFDPILAGNIGATHSTYVGLYNATETSSIKPENLIYSYGTDTSKNGSRSFVKDIPLRFGSIHWTLHVTEPISLHITLLQRELPAIAGGLMALLIFLIIGIYRTLKNTRVRATEIAEELSETERRLIKTAPDAIVMLDATGAFISINEAALAMFGYATEEIRGKHFSEIGALTPTSLLKATEEFARIMSGEPRALFELEIKQKSGHLLIIEISASAVYKKSEIAGVQLILRDATERKRTERRLKEYAETVERAEKRYHTLFESANDAIFIMDTHTFIECNKVTLSMFGCNMPSDIIGHAPWEFSPKMQPDGRTSDEKAMEKISAAFAGKPQRFYWKHTKKDGTPFDAEVSLNRLDIGGKHYLQALVRDITAERRADENLHASLLELQKFKLAVDSASDHIIITDPEGIVQYANKAAERITGYTIQEILGQKAGKIWGGLMPKEFYRELWNTIKVQKKLFVGEMHNRRKNGEEYIALVDISPILDEKGAVQFFVAIERDITREKEIDRAKTEFVSLASHQLRTPLTAITWYAEMLLGGDAGEISDKQRRYASEIYAGGRRLVSLVNALLSVSRIELGTFAIEPEPSDLVALCETPMKEMMPLVAKKHITLTSSFEKELPEVNVDKNLMRIVFQNLISNAVDYTRENGKVHVELKQVGEEIIFSVADNGIGIPAAAQSKIFDKLFRADNAVETKTDGTGLGLYIVRSIIDKGGGRIWFVSRENQGTTFFVAIPRAGMKAKTGEKKLTMT